MDRTTITHDARRTLGVRPPDDADPQTLPASQIKANGGAANDTDISGLAPRGTTGGGGGSGAGATTTTTTVTITTTRTTTRTTTTTSGGGGGAMAAK